MDGLAINDLPQDSLRSSIKNSVLQQYISSAAEIIEEARAGRIFMLVDDEDRESSCHC
jgi:3,4-dihydroxy 2-butanone 4-phosphate synthase/GTP cyclohydrolase II